MNTERSERVPGLLHIKSSVLLVTHNSAGVIAACLEHLLAVPAHPGSFEIIVVDNGSTDDTCKIVRSNFPGMYLIANQNNSGFAAGVNRGFRHSRGEILLLLNPDAVVGSGFVTSMADLMNSIPEAAVMGFRITGRDGSPQPSCWKTPSILTLLFESFLPYGVSLRLLAKSPDMSSEVEMVSGACMAIRRPVFEKLRGFDERFFMYYEDVDFCLRARQQGFKIYFCPDATAVHELRKPPQAQSVSFFLNLYRSKFEFVRKHFPPVGSAIARFMIVLGILIRIPAYLVAGVLGMDREMIRLSKSHAELLPRLLQAD